MFSPYNKLEPPKTNSKSVSNNNVSKSIEICMDCYDRVKIYVSYSFKYFGLQTSSKVCHCQRKQVKYLDNHHFVTVTYLLIYIYS